MALADDFDGFLIALDGVVWVGREMLPGAAEALRGLQERGLEIVFITNNPGKPSSSYAERLREAGVEIDAGRVVTAGGSTGRLAAARGRAGGGGVGGGVASARPPPPWGAAGGGGGGGWGSRTPRPGRRRASSSSPATA